MATLPRKSHLTALLTLLLSIVVITFCLLLCQMTQMSSFEQVSVNITVQLGQSSFFSRVFSQISCGWSHRERRKSYMLALHTVEQLTMSTSHYVEFLNMVHEWNFTGVEPFVYRSRMFALRSMHQGDINGSVHYHQLLNTTFMRENLSECLQKTNKDKESNITTKLFVPVREFLDKSERKIALVYFSKHMNTVGNHIHKTIDMRLKSLNTNYPVIDCTQISQESGMAREVERLMNQELLNEDQHYQKFSVVQAFCIMPSVEVSLSEIQTFVMKHISRDSCTAIPAIDVSIVFISWQGKFTRQFADIDKLFRCTLPTDRIPPSSEVISAADRFLQSQSLQRSSYIAVHIRFEKLFDQVYKQNNSRQLLQCCMFKLDAVLRRMKEQYNLTTECSTLLLHDFSHYGSDVCRHDGRWTKRDICVKDAQYLLSVLNETAPVEFDPIKFNVPKNAGFVSRVEGLSLNGGWVLVAIGGGSYQKSIVNRFHAEHRSKSVNHREEPVVYHLCAKRDETFPGIDFNKIQECMDV